MSEETKEKALEVALSQIRKRYGDGAIMKLGSAQSLDVEVIPTGSISLDIALGVGGIPRGRVVEIFGPESSGKTTLCQHILAEAQKLGGVAAFIDVEHALDPEYARKCGVDIDNLYVSQPDTAEQALEIADALVHSSAVDLIVIDSVAALVPQAELSGDMGEAHVGLQARLMSQALRKLAGAISRSNTAVIFTNQIRMRIGVMYGNPETTPGGRALKHAAALRLDMRRIQSLKEGTQVTGDRTRVSVKKNKVAPPFRWAEFDIIHGQGVSKEGDVLDTAAEWGIIEKKGSFYSYGELRLGQGRENAKAFLHNDPKLLEEIDQKTREAAGLVRATKKEGAVKPVPSESRTRRRSEKSSAMEPAAQLRGDAHREGEFAEAD